MFRIVIQKLLQYRITLPFSSNRTDSPGRTVREWLLWIWENIKQLGIRIDEDHVFMLAAGIAFNIITSLVPAILILLFVLGYLLDSATVINELNAVASSLIVAVGDQGTLLEELRAQIDSLIANRGIAGVFGFFGLLWTSSTLASSIRVSINNVMRCREQRFFLIYKLYDILSIILIGFLVLLSILVGPVLQVVLSVSDQIASKIPIVNLEWFIPSLISLVVTLLLFYTIYRYMPYQKQQWHIILVGTIVSTFLWEFARYVFSFYLTEFRTFSRIYGAYAYFAAAAFWIYYSSLVFLIGAEVAYHVKQSRWNARRLFNKISNEGATEYRKK